MSNEPTIPYLWVPPKPSVSNIKPSICKRDDPIRLQEEYIDLAVSLVGHFELLYADSPLKNSGLDPELLFD